MEYVSPEGLRIDGRRPKELRRLECSLDVLQSADGSSVFQMGNTKVSEWVSVTSTGWLLLMSVLQSAEQHHGL